MIKSLYFAVYYRLCPLEGGFLMTLQQLRYIVEISKNHSICKAAQSLFITQPSISKAIKDLEDELDITIFEQYRSRYSIYIRWYRTALLC